MVFTFDNINRLIPDNSALGLNDARIVSTPFTLTVKVAISLTILRRF